MPRQKKESVDEVTSPDIYSISLILRPQNEGILPQRHGYQAYALFLNILRQSNVPLTNGLHDLDGPKPFTISSLYGSFRRTSAGLEIKPETTCRLRLTFLNSQVFAHFLDGAMKWGDIPVELSPMTFKVEKVATVPNGDPLTRLQSYQSIIESAQTQRQIDLEFLSPTAFRSGGKRNVIFPEPALVFGSYLNRWQLFSTIKLHDSVTSWFDKMIVSRYKLETRIWDFGSYQEVGFTGRCRFDIDRSVPNDVVSALNALADFAYFCGTGAKTTVGMGQTKRLAGTRSLSGEIGDSDVPDC